MDTYRTYSLKKRGLINVSKEEDHPKRVAYDNESTESVHKLNEKVKVEVSEKHKGAAQENKMRRRHRCEPMEITE